MNLPARLAQLGLTLPAVAPPVAAYVPAVCTDTAVWVSGQLPLEDGELLCEGCVPEEVSLDAATRAAKRCALNALAAAHHAVAGEWGGFQRVARLAVYVYADPDFSEAHKVANGASELLVEVLGDAGRHARVAVAVAGLPMRAPVMAELVLAWR